jgi:hypothetical protein
MPQFDRSEDWRTGRIGGRYACCCLRESIEEWNAVYQAESVPQPKKGKWHSVIATDWPLSCPWRSWAVGIMGVVWHEQLERAVALKGAAARSNR